MLLRRALTSILAAAGSRRATWARAALSGAAAARQSTGSSGSSDASVRSAARSDATSGSSDFDAARATVGSSGATSSSGQSAPSGARASHSSDASPSRSYAASGGSNDFDVVVSGAGPAGAALVASLATSPLTSALRIAWLSNAPFGVRRAPAPDAVRPDAAAPPARVFAVALSAVRLLRALDVWDEVRPLATPYSRMHVWDARGPGAIEYDAALVNEEALGYIVHNDALEYALTERVRGLDNVELIPSATIESLRRPPADSETLTAALSGDRHLRTSLLVGADSARSRVRELARIGSVRYEYEQVATVANVLTEAPFDTCYQVFEGHSPLALLPYGQHASIVWSCSTERTAELAALGDDAFVALLNETLARHNTDGHTLAAGLGRSLAALLPPLGERVEALADAATHMFAAPRAPRVTGLASKRAGFPLAVSSARTYVKPSVALIGDAAHTVHPMAGQGVNMGLQDVVHLTHALQEALDTGIHIGSLSTLREYERRALLPNAAKQAGLHALHSLFGLEHNAFALARSLGLSAVSSLRPLKARMAQVATGVDLNLQRIGRNL